MRPKKLGGLKGRIKVPDAKTGRSGPPTDSRELVHLVIQTADRLTVVDVKVSATITADMLAGAARVAAILAAAGKVKAAAVHAGAMRQDRTGASAIPWESVADILE